MNDDDIEKSYGPLTRLGGNARFETFRGTKDGRNVFIKRAADPALEDRLLIEAVGLSGMRELDAAERFYTVPGAIVVNGNTLVTDWADGEPMEKAFTDKDDTVIDHSLGRLADLYAFVDGRSMGQRGITRYSGPGNDGIARFASKLEDAGYERHVDAGLVRETLDYLRRTLPLTDTRFTNGDMTPGNILVDGAVIRLVDCETVSWLWPRHYNVVNLTFNYGLRFPALRGRLGEMFQSYCAKVGTDPRRDVDAFNVTAALRSLGTIIERLTIIKNNGGQLPDDVRQYVETMMRRITREGVLFVDW